mmetsp:Transcript_17458/g.43946  ORF Transcript_17458/g.43946 Transcript_17458/m.43946 type:complete len:298 (-) Transcript_17458:359-1252(-)
MESGSKPRTKKHYCWDSMHLPHSLRTSGVCDLPCCSRLWCARTAAASTSLLLSHLASTGAWPCIMAQMLGDANTTGRQQPGPTDRTPPTTMCLLFKSRPLHVGPPHTSQQRGRMTTLLPHRCPAQHHLPPAPPAPCTGAVHVRTSNAHGSACAQEQCTSKVFHAPHSSAHTSSHILSHNRFPHADHGQITVKHAPCAACMPESGNSDSTSSHHLSSPRRHDRHGCKPGRQHSHLSLLSLLHPRLLPRLLALRCRCVQCGRPVLVLELLLLLLAATTPKVLPPLEAVLFPFVKEIGFG